MQGRLSNNNQPLKKTQERLRARSSVSGGVDRNAEGKLPVDGSEIRLASWYSWNGKETILNRV